MALTDWAPTVDDVGAILRARTVDDNGNELGTFTADTRPTDAQVATLLGAAQDDVLAALLRQDVDAMWWPATQAVTALGVALLVELSFFPEQVASGRSPYTELKALYDQRLPRLVVRINAGEAATSTTPGEAPNNPASPSFAFPGLTPAPLPMGEGPYPINWNSEW